MTTALKGNPRFLDASDDDGPDHPGGARALVKREAPSMYHGVLYKKPGYDLAPYEDVIPNTPVNPHAGWLHWARKITRPRLFRDSCLNDPDQQFEEPAAFGTHHGVVP